MLVTDEESELMVVSIDSTDESELMVVSVELDNGFELMVAAVSVFFPRGMGRGCV